MSSHFNARLSFQPCSAPSVVGMPLTLRAQSTTSAAESTPSPLLSSQGQFVKITLNDGTLKFGQLLDADESNILVDLVGLGPTSIPKYLVLEMIQEVMEVDESGEVKNLVSSQATRYFFAPSAMQLKDGEGYFQSNIALNSVSYGLSDKFTVGAMIGFLGGGLTAKAGWKVGEKTSISLGVLAAADFFGELEKPLALGFINVTRGDDNKNITFNVGCTNAAFGPRYPEYYSPGAPSVDNDWGPPITIQKAGTVVISGLDVEHQWHGAVDGEALADHGELFRQGEYVC